MGSNSNRLFSHCFRKKKNQQLQNLCKLLISSVDQPGLEPGTSRLWVCCSNQLSYKSEIVCKDTRFWGIMQIFPGKSCGRVGMRPLIRTSREGGFAWKKEAGRWINPVFLSILLAYSYLCRRYSRSKMERKKRNKFCFSFYFARLFVHLEKVLSLENGKEKDEYILFFFLFCSLIRTSGEGTLARKWKGKRGINSVFLSILLAYSYLYRRYSRSKMERKKMNKSCFSFYFARLFVPL